MRGVTQQQLDCLLALTRNGFHFSKAATELCLSQPGVSRHLQQLEDCVGQALFEREGRSIRALSPAGEELVERAYRLRGEWESLWARSGHLGVPPKPKLRLATTHTQAVYRLPEPLAKFRQERPDVELELLQGTPEQCVAWVLEGMADLAIATEALSRRTELRLLPCYQWNRCFLAPVGHPLTLVDQPSLTEACEYPLLSYNLGITGRAAMDEGFRAAGITPQFALTAVDAEVIKTYVRAGFGVGIVARMAWSPERDGDLVLMDAQNCFPWSTAWLGVPRQGAVPPHVEAFVRAFAPEAPESWLAAFRRGENLNWDLDLLPRV